MISDLTILALFCPIELELVDEIFLYLKQIIHHFLIYYNSVTYLSRL
jgi:hypothetical protein